MVLLSLTMMLPLLPVSCLSVVVNEWWPIDWIDLFGYLWCLMNDIDDVDDDGDGADDSLWNSVEWIVRTMMDKNCDMDSSVDLY